MQGRNFILDSGESPRGDRGAVPSLHSGHPTQTAPKEINHDKDPFSD